MWGEQTFGSFYLGMIESIAFNFGLGTAYLSHILVSGTGFTWRSDPSIMPVVAEMLSIPPSFPPLPAIIMEKRYAGGVLALSSLTLVPQKII